MTTIVPSSLPFDGLLRLCCGRLTSWRALAYVLGCALIASFTVGAAQACPLTAPRSSVTDPAAHLGQHAGAIAQRLAAYRQASGHQLFVVIAPSLDEGMSVEQCAVAVFQNWKLGRKGVDDGVLLLVAIKERKMRIEVGYGLEGVLTDARSSRIIHEVMQPLFARGEIAEGVERGLGAIMAVIGSGGPARAAPESSGADDANNELIGKFVVSGLGLMVLLVSTIAGIIGLLFFGMPITGLVYYSYQDWRGWLFAGAYVLVWCAVRWLTIRANVKKYHLKKSRNKMLTWIRCFAASGLAESDKARQRKPRASSTASTVADEGFSFSFAGSGDGGGSSGDSSTDSSGSSDDSGGASGGGGASGNW
jgi:uncharacterized membrane protein YgcG